jgi:hypothetical protein
VNSSHARSDALHEQLQRAIAGSVGDQRWVWSDERFNKLSGQVFEHQALGSEAYSRYCRGRDVLPGAQGSWLDIPAVPTDVFRSLNLCSFPVEQSSVVFKTSGTTSGARGQHFLRRTDTYSASLALWMRTFLLPVDDEPRVVVLAPSAAQDAHSSLSFMLQWAVDVQGGPGSAFFWDSSGPMLVDAVQSLRAASIEGQPVLLLGTARALQALLEGFVAGQLGPPPTLPTGSRLMETGGFKGAARTLSREMFYEGLSKALGLPTFAIISEYGMTELASQGYQPSLLMKADGEVSDYLHRLAAALPEGLDDEGLGRCFIFPPWCRVRSVDPQTLKILPEGERGLLRFWDLANVDSISVVQTADVGVVGGGAMVLAGRAPEATARGCSLAVDEVLAAARMGAVQ